MDELQRRAGANLDLYIAGGATSLDGLTNALDGLATRGEVAAALDQLHPEPYDAHKQIGFMHNQQFAGSMEQYLRTVRMKSCMYS